MDILYCKIGGPRGSHIWHEDHSWLVFVASWVKHRALELDMNLSSPLWQCKRKGSVA